MNIFKIFSQNTECFLFNPQDPVLDLIVRLERAFETISLSIEGEGPEALSLIEYSDCHTY